MTYLSEVIEVNPKFRSAVRLDRDFANANLDNYVVHETAARILEKVFDSIETRGFIAATWTGPYGSGKSSLAVFLSRLLAGDVKSRTAAQKMLSAKLALKAKALVRGARDGWMAVHVVGRRQDGAHLIRASLRDAIKLRWPRRRALLESLSEESKDGGDIISAIREIANLLSAEKSGLLLIVDEMGKVLENATYAGADIHFFQDLAEVIADCGCKVALTGILHQSFEEYARGLGAANRDEWAKIQGRYEDIPFSLSLDENIQLLSGAISGDAKHKNDAKRVKALLKAIDSPRLNNAAVEAGLVSSWPLHPLTALLLGPFSRRSFAQNERSIFSFLASRDPGGFVDYLGSTELENAETYSPARLWDYLQHNFEPAILSSRQDSKLYSEAAEAIDRAAKKGGKLHVDLAKSIALLEMFGRPFGLNASEAVLIAAHDAEKPAALRSALQDLSAWSVAVCRAYSKSWGVFAGSDIDLNQAVDVARDQLASDEAAIVAQVPSLAPIVAKKHYQKTGTLRWFERIVVSLQNAPRQLDDYLKMSVCAGVFVVCASKEAISEQDEKLLRQELDHIAAGHFVPLLISFNFGADGVLNAAHEAAALLRLKSSLPALAGDAVARRELAARIHAANEDLIERVDRAFETARWSLKGVEKVGGGSAQELSRMSSDLCDEFYRSAPRIFNELINRDRISPNVAAARRKLMYAMVTNASKTNLDISGYPPEMSLYLSLFKQSGLHSKGKTGSKTDLLFVEPPENDPQNFRSVYDALDRFMTERAGRNISTNEVFAFLRRPPFGLRHAVMPIIFLHYSLIRHDRVALYREDFYSPEWTEEIVDQLLQRPETIAVRWVESKIVNRDLLTKVAGFVECSFDEAPGETALEVTKPLVQFVLRLPPFVRRTNSLSASTRALRDALANATDPFTLLFNDIPAALGLRGDDGSANADGKRIDELADRLSAAMTELMNAEANTIAALKKSIFSTLQAGVGTASDYEELRARSKILPSDTGDERLNGLIARARGATDSDEWVKAVASLAAGKPYRSWTDPDVSAAKLQLIDLGRRFTHVESFVFANRKRGRTVSYALTLHDNSTGTPQTVSNSLTLNKKSQAEVDATLIKLRAAVGSLRLELPLKKAAIVSLLMELDEAEDDPIEQAIAS